MAPSPLPQRDLFSHHQRPKALFLDAAGTFLIPSEGVADVYLRYGAPYGVTLTPQEVLSRFRSAYNDPWSAHPSHPLSLPRCVCLLFAAQINVLWPPSAIV